MLLLALSVLPLMAKKSSKSINIIPVVLDTHKNVTRRPFPEALCHLPETEALRDKATSLPACLYKADIFLNPFYLFLLFVTRTSRRRGVEAEPVRPLCKQ